MAKSTVSSGETDSVDGDTIEVKCEAVEQMLSDDNTSVSNRVKAIKDEAAGSRPGSPAPLASSSKLSRSSSSSTVKSRASSEMSSEKREADEMHEDECLKLEPPQPKSSRAASHKLNSRAPLLFDYFEDATVEAKSTFSVMENCTYANKFLGYTEHAMECDCTEEWDATAKRNFACGDDSDCINRATKMECVGDCGCGSACQNQRFQRRQYADVSVIKTEKKGFGLRANADLRPHDFIFEYIGEVINEPQFRRRMLQYDEEGIKHFYFMSLSKGEFVDATKRGNLGRFCNHSCNPNCYVDKWVIGDKLRMGIFAERNIKAGEELVFNYNVDRYGANPQPCYCGETNCTGFIGGKTQTERATKLSAATIEALGIEDDDGWDTTVAKRPRKKKTGEDDEDYVDSVEAKTLDTDGVTKVMAALMQCKEKWIAVKLLQRIQRSNDEQVRNRIVKMHGYQILNSQLAAWKEDVNVVLQILDILDSFPRLTRNKIIDSKIETTLQPFTSNEDGRVASQSARLLDEWAKLEVAYRIPRKKRDPTDQSTPQKSDPIRFDRRESREERKRSRSRSRTPPRGPSTSSAPSGPRSSAPQRNNSYYAPRPPPFNRNFAALPRGWFQASDQGKTYYYSASGQTTWTRPTQPAEQPPPPPKQPSNQDVLKSIIDGIVSAKEKEKEAKNATPNTPQAQKREKKDKKEEKWRSYDEPKKKKVYENTLFPHILHVMNKYKAKIPRDDLKRFAKEISKKLVDSDFKSGRVDNPTKISDKHQHKVKKYCKEFFDKAAHKHHKHEKEKAAKRAAEAEQKVTNGDTPAAASTRPKLVASFDADDVKKEEDSDNEDVKMSEDEADDIKTSPPSPSANWADEETLKRKRNPPDEEDLEMKEDDDSTKSPMKKLHLDSPPPPPPPPPAPPMETPDQTPGQSEDASPIDTALHADTSFRSKSMADVLAEAQQDPGDDEDADSSRQEAHTRFEGEMKANKMLREGNMLDQPMLDGQSAVEEIKLEGS